MNKNKYDPIAVDIAKNSLQIQTKKKSFKLPNDETGFAKLINEISAFDSPLVVCEATGGYERDLMRTLHQNKIPVALLNPRLVRAFALSEGIKAKSDPIDAKMLMRFSEEKKLRATQPPDPKKQDIADYLDRRSHLTELLTKEKNRLQKAPQITKDLIQDMIYQIERQIAIIDQRIEQIIESREDLKKQNEIFQSVKGVGEITSWSIIAYLSEISFLGRNQLVALVGLAPFNRDSGKSIAPRRICAGRAKIRKCLYMAAQTAAQHNDVIKEYVQGLIDRGKHYKMAMVAAMRKILIHLQSLLKKSLKNA